MAAAVRELIDRLEVAYNDHDIDAFAALFSLDYSSEQPAHPGRSFRGREQLRANWTNVFTTVPDLRAERLSMVDAGDEAWTEWRWTGTTTSGLPVDLRGVIIFGFADGVITWGRLYMEDVEQGSSEGGAGGIRADRHA